MDRTVSPDRARYDFHHSTLYSVGECTDVAMPAFSNTHKITFVKLNLVKIVFIGHLENRWWGRFLRKNFGTM